MLSANGNSASIDAMDVDPAPMSAVGQSTTSPQVLSPTPVGGPSSRVGYVYSPEMLVHFQRDTSEEDEHVERPERIRRIMSVLENRGLLLRMKELPVRPILKHEALLVHSEDHWNNIMAFESTIFTHLY